MGRFAGIRVVSRTQKEAEGNIGVLTNFKYSEADKGKVNRVNRVKTDCVLKYVQSLKVTKCISILRVCLICSLTPDRNFQSGSCLHVAVVRSTSRYGN